MLSLLNRSRQLTYRLVTISR